jgi:hypothetical protein
LSAEAPSIRPTAAVEVSYFDSGVATDDLFALHERAVGDDRFAAVATVADGGGRGRRLELLAVEHARAMLGGPATDAAYRWRRSSADSASKAAWWSGEPQNNRTYFIHVDLPRADVE